MSRRLALLAQVVGDTGLMADGDWVESKDQDPNGDVRLIQLADVGDGEFINKSNRFLTSDKATQLRCTFLKAGDILVSRMADPIGRACTFPGDAKRCVAVVDICVIRPDPNIANSEWLKYAINTPRFRSIVESRAVGATRPRISGKNLKAMEIDLPPLQEQRRIVDLLSRAEGIVRLRREAEKKAAELIPALFIDMFGDPTTNPKGWPVKRFETFGVCRLGKMLDKKKQSGEFQRPYLRNVNVQWDRIDTYDLLSMDFRPAEQSTFLVQPGDVLICEGGDIGRSAVWRGSLEECFYQKALHKLTPDLSTTRPDFVVWLLWHLAKTGALLGSSTHATIAHLTGVQLKKMNVIVPPISLQSEFGLHVDSCHAIQSQQAAATTTAKAAFDALLARFFSKDI